MKKKNIYLTIAVLQLVVTVALAQNRSYEGPNKMNTWSVSAYGGLTRFFGDLSENETKPGQSAGLTYGWGLSVNKQITPVFGAQIVFRNGDLRGSKRGVQGIDLLTKEPILEGGVPKTYDVYFKSPSFLQASLDGTMNLNRLLLGPNKMRRWKIDAHAGFGIMYFHSRLYDMATDEEKLRTNTSGSSKTAGTWNRNGSVYTREWVFPVGLSVNYELSPRFDIGVDFHYNHVNTEKLDLTIGSLTDYDRQSGIWGFYKGDSNQDKWGSAMVSLTYKIGKSAAMGKKGTYNASGGRYHLRWASPSQLIAPVYNPTLSDADSVAKANMPKPVDQRLYTDSDGDGVADLFDQEPNTPPGSIVSGAGVAMDLKKRITELVSNQVPKEECEALFSNIEFDTDKSTIRKASQEILNQVAALLNQRPNCRIVLVGNTDSRASYSYNNALSKRRVEAARKYLIKAGLNDPSRILTEYYGEYRPVAENTTASGMQSNRRVEIKILPASDLRSVYPGGFRNR